MTEYTSSLPVFIKFSSFGPIRYPLTIKKDSLLLSCMRIANDCLLISETFEANNDFKHFSWQISLREFVIVDTLLGSGDVFINVR